MRKEFWRIRRPLPQAKSARPEDLDYLILQLDRWRNNFSSEENVIDVDVLENGP